MEKIDEYAFYRGKRGKIRYNEKCANCFNECKQSHRAEIVRCSDYISCEKNDCADPIKTTGRKFTQKEV